MSVLNYKVFKNYSYLKDDLKLISKFQNNDSNTFEYLCFESKITKYLYSNYRIIVEVFTNYKEL